MVKKTIHAFKFSGKKRLAAEVINRACGYLFQRGDGVVLVPVPQSRNRFAGRGYNQATVIAQCLAKQYHLPYMECLTESNGPVPLHLQNRETRLSVGRLITIKHVLPAKSLVMLVDDVLTTGSTVDACKRVIEAAGHRVIGAVTLTYTEPKY